jgi:hypothetical protein
LKWRSAMAACFSKTSLKLAIFSNAFSIRRNTPRKRPLTIRLPLLLKRCLLRLLRLGPEATRATRADEFISTWVPSTTTICHLRNGARYTLSWPARALRKKWLPITASLSRTTSGSRVAH